MAAKMWRRGCNSLPIRATVPIKPEANVAAAVEAAAAVSVLAPQGVGR